MVLFIIFITHKNWHYTTLRIYNMTWVYAQSQTKTRHLTFSFRILVFDEENQCLRSMWGLLVKASFEKGTHPFQLPQVKCETVLSFLCVSLQWFKGRRRFHDFCCHSADKTKTFFDVQMTWWSVFLKIKFLFGNENVLYIATYSYRRREHNI